MIKRLVAAGLMVLGLTLAAPVAPAGADYVPPLNPASQWPYGDDGWMFGVPQDGYWGKRVVYSVSSQRVWLVDNVAGADVLAATFLVSGRAGTPRPGVYATFSQSIWARSGSVRMQFMTRFARGRRLAIGFHGIPINRRGEPIQSEAELGQYRSHGCVRMRVEDAHYMYMWAGVGTPVVVLP